MKAMVINSVGKAVSRDAFPLTLTEIPCPKLSGGEILIKVSVCGVCHTELDEIEGRTPPRFLPIIPGHQIVGRIAETGDGVKRFSIGDRVGTGWIFGACGKCRFCVEGNENLCSSFTATGRDADGGYAEFMKIKEDFAFPIPDQFTDAEAAPLLCAGAIGYRSVRLAKISGTKTLGLTGFGASGHLVLKMVRYRYPDVKVYVFARNEKERKFARELGAVWAGDINDVSPEKLQSIIDTTPVWTPVVEALKNLEPGGRLVINAIGKEETDKTALLSICYPRHLWLEKEIKSVANVTRSDIAEFLILASQIGIRPKVKEYSLEEANTALWELKEGKIRGAKVLRIGYA